MTETYYECRDLEDFANIGEHAPEAGSKFFEYYATATGAGKLSEREKALIALTVATVRHCPDHGSGLHGALLGRDRLRPVEGPA